MTLTADSGRGRFPRSARLLSGADFARLRGRSRRVHSRYFSAEVASAPSALPRLGLAVSRRVSAQAVGRNRIKRIARDSFRRRRAEFPAVDVVLIPRHAAAAVSNAALHDDLLALWQKIAALNAPAGTGTMHG